jgi:hypothetical protein
MSEKKNAKYIYTEDIRPPIPANSGFLKRMQEQRAAGNFMNSVHMLSLGNQNAQGTLYFDSVWITGLHGTQGVQVEIQHSHDFDEIIGFFGNQPNNYRDLGGEIEFWLEDEEYSLTKSCVIFCPRGMKHLPLRFKRVDSPILFLTMGNGTAYTRATGNESPVG